MPGVSAHRTVRAGVHVRRGWPTFLLMRDDMRLMARMISRRRSADRGIDRWFVIFRFADTTDDRATQRMSKAQLGLG